MESITRKGFPEDTRLKLRHSQRARVRHVKGKEGGGKVVRSEGMRCESFLFFPQQEYFQYINPYKLAWLPSIPMLGSWISFPTQPGALCKRIRQNLAPMWEEQGQRRQEHKPLEYDFHVVGAMLTNSYYPIQSLKQSL